MTTMVQWCQVWHNNLCKWIPERYENDREKCFWISFMKCVWIGKFDNMFEVRWNKAEQRTVYDFTQTYNENVWCQKQVYITQVIGEFRQFATFLSGFLQINIFCFAISHLALVDISYVD